MPREPDQPAAEAVCRDPQDDEKPEPGDYAQDAAGHEIPPDVIRRAVRGHGPGSRRIGKLKL